MFSPAFAVVASQADRREKKSFFLVRIRPVSGVLVVSLEHANVKKIVIKQVCGLFSRGTVVFRHDGC